MAMVPETISHAPRKIATAPGRARARR
jgi:hypothetical protein